MNPIVKLDIFKNLLGEADAEQDAEQRQESEEEARSSMTEVKLERDDLKTLMREAMAACLLYTSPSPRDKRQSRMPSSA